MNFDLHRITSSTRYIDPRNITKFLTKDEERDFYEAFLKEQFILRDHLAIDRTMLANESTFLAYIRTGLAMSAAGATLLHFVEEKFSDIIGISLVAGGVVIFLIGVLRYRAMRRVINHIREHKDSNIKKLQDDSAQA